jgi:hypothetical protein
MERGVSRNLQHPATAIFANSHGTQSPIRELNPPRMKICAVAEPKCAITRHVLQIQLQIQNIYAPPWLTS